MTDYLQLPLFFDTVRLASDLQKVRPEEWVTHYVTQNYEGNWSATALRSADGTATDVFASKLSEPHRDTSLLQRCIYFQEVLATFQCSTLSVRLMLLGPGSRIHEHTDFNLSVEDNGVRLHIPISTSSEVEFYLNSNRIRMKPGECWYLNFNLPHRVYNGSSQPRIHLVIDCEVNDWLRNLLNRSGYQSPKKTMWEQRGIRKEDVDEVIQSLRFQNTEASLQLAKELEQLR